MGGAVMFEIIGLLFATIIFFGLSGVLSCIYSLIAWLIVKGKGAPQILDLNRELTTAIFGGLHISLQHCLLFRSGAVGLSFW